MKIKQARSLTGYEKVPWYEGYNLCLCDYCEREMNRYNSCNELKTSYEYDEYNQACNKCVINMAQAVQDDVDVVAGLF